VDFPSTHVVVARRIFTPGCHQGADLETLNTRHRVPAMGTWRLVGMPNIGMAWHPRLASVVLRDSLSRDSLSRGRDVPNRHAKKRVSGQEAGGSPHAWIL
jgi:hypothetical protein